MELIVLIVIIIFAVLNGNSKKKGKAAKTAAANRARQAAGQPWGAPPVEPAPEVRADIREAFSRPPEPVRAADPAPVAASPIPSEGRSMLADEECRGGSMPHAHAEGHSALEDEDCGGGSMAHTHTEGVSRRAHARRMADADAAHARPDAAPEPAIDARALRRAVVMAEVLGKPRALKRL